MTDPHAVPPPYVDDAASRRGPVERFFGGPPLGVAARLLMLSLVVGVILSVLGLDPFNILESLVDFVQWIVRRFEDVFHLGFDAVEWIIRYILLGAAVVIPIWLLVRFTKLSGR